MDTNTLEKFLSEDRIATIETIKKHTDYPDLNLYSMEVLYDYNLDHLTPKGIHDTQHLMELIFAEALPGVEVDYQAPKYGCSAFTLKDEDGTVRMGRNYDFKFDSSAMLVRCHPKDGYASVGHGAVDNICVKDPFISEKERAACLASPFICIDGINEKGVGIAVLTLDSEPLCHKTGKPVLPTTVLIRLVLDRAASTSEAVELLRGYDMFSICGRDYHFYITDASGDGRIIEFDCDTPDRAMVVTPTDAVTNFYILHKDKALPNQTNGIYGHGRERYDAIKAVFGKHGGQGGINVAWEALRAAAQMPNPDSITSNTQWSIAYDLTNLEYEFVLHRHWDDVLSFKLFE